MIVGVPREIKSEEYRVALVPAGAEELTRAGHEVVVESGAGEGSGFEDDRYARAGAEVATEATEVWERADMILKVKEPLPAEYDRISPGQVLFTYFHFAASEQLTRAMLEQECVAVAYETVQLPGGELPLLTPMSEVAGRMAVQVGAWSLERAHGGAGLLLGGVPGVLPAEVAVVGGGTVGSNAARIAAGYGAHVTVLDVDLDRLRYLADTMPANVDTVYSNRLNILEQLERADLFVGAVLRPGAKAPNLVRGGDLERMEEGSVIVDVAVDQGGCVETIRPTTHSDPTYVVDGVIHYGVANMPGAVPRTSTLALTNATMPYARRLADSGWQEACRQDRALRKGLNAVRGACTYEAVADAFGLEYTPVEEVL